MNLPGLPLLGWMDACLIMFDRCIVVGSRFQAPPQAFLPGGLITAVSPDTAGFGLPLSTDGVLSKAWQSFGKVQIQCKENG